MPPLRRVLLNRAWLFALSYALFAYAFHSYGNATGLYVRHWWFQLAAHYVSASAVALLVARVGLDVGLRGRSLVGFVAFFGAAAALGWEFVEYLGLFENLHFWGIEDAAVDLLADAAGIGTVIALLRTRIKPVLDPDEEATLGSVVETSE